MKEAATTLIWAAPRTEGCDELLTIRKQLVAKFGKEFGMIASENSELSVNSRVVDQLSIHVPEPYVCYQELQNIANEACLEWVPSESSVSGVPGARPLADYRGLPGGGEDGGPPGGPGGDIPGQPYNVGANRGLGEPCDPDLLPSPPRGSEPPPPIGVPHGHPAPGHPAPQYQAHQAPQYQHPPPIGVGQGAPPVQPQPMPSAPAPREYAPPKEQPAPLPDYSAPSPSYSPYPGSAQPPQSPPASGNTIAGSQPPANDPGFGGPSDAPPASGDEIANDIAALEARFAAVKRM
eukprot:NODE_2728_length_1052_cov_14.619143_g2276_i0.p1 GENE.NODE_2728_length_1052_cov_14.619143_g2276_i0~~NODE_2728_length_1052_cov_14.619143_g2276_i0.p1  ORF type:complete len:314 (+),score=63.04 NODE_2728_length_1052_cov_14.619143_g2276_i0:67-942(+)